VTLTTPMVIAATARLTWQALGADDTACAVCEVRTGSSAGCGYRTPRRRASAMASMRDDTPSLM
jgi:hypothetical protein